MNPMKDFFIRILMAVNSFLIRASRGRIGSRLGTQTVLILHTIGRKSGQPREVPIAYFALDGKYMIVASNWGKDREAEWLLNLRKHPQATIDVNGKSIRVKTYEAQGEEYDQLWKFATGRHPPYLDYQKMTSRRIPIVVLLPT
ncbi:MAG: nitroreductase/quinone reductase family protein [Chloroflexota bacterium]